ncbi:MAG: putative baseplate assembly protein [Acidimicrobiales bacterium]
MVDRSGAAGGLACAGDGRRALVRAGGLNGVDCIEVGGDGRHLCVHFIGGVPEGLGVANLRVEGGRRVRDLRVLSMRVRPPGDSDDEECLELTLDRAGDQSTYRLCVAEVDDRGRPTGHPYPGFDQRYACACFTFTVDCPSTLDCLADDDCPEEPGETPAIDYLVRDYPGFRRLLLDRMALLVPGWAERHVPDLGVTLVELLAYVADHLAYAQDAVATEAYLGTARHRISVRRHTRLVDYALSEGCNARAFVVVRVEGAPTFAAPAGELRFLTRFPGAPPPGTLLDGDRIPAGPYECFEPVVEASTQLTFKAPHNEIRLWTWGDGECCLGTGTTRAWLVDGRPEAPPPGPTDAACDQVPSEPGGEGERVLSLAPGDLVLFEEVLGPRTGNPADADPARRHVVRLTRVTPVVDELLHQPLLDVEWDEDDALPFPLCVSSVGPPPGCLPLEAVSVARGNVVLVDHGCTVGPEPLDPVPDPPASDCCIGPCQPGDVAAPVPRYRPRPLAGRPVTFATRPDEGALPLPATALLVQDPRLAMAQVQLQGRPADPADDTPSGPPWVVRPDLLRSGPDDRHLVVEVDDDGAAHVRVGDDRLGEGPEPGTRFTACYRVGNGKAGNVGAETITYVARAGLDEHGVAVSARNPLAASGGTDPESTALAKLLAPRAFRSRLERAVVADDYALLATRDVTALQGAAATLRWTGSWYEVLVAADQRGRADPEAEVLAAVAQRLERYRRMGHDVAVAPARPVPLLIRISVCVAPHHLRADVESALRRLFSARRNADGTRGWFHPDNHLPGGSVATSAVVAAAQAVDGVESVEVVVLRRLFADEGGPERPLGGLLRLGPLEVARADSDPVTPDNGAVTYDLRGGR